MASVKLMKMDGSEAGTIELSDMIFDTPLNETVVHNASVAIRNAARQGNAETKTRKQVRGGGAKPYSQKGTGNARHGSTREPQMRGGGVVFGPHKRSYAQKVPVSVKRKALCCMLSDRVRSGSLCVLDDLQCEQPRTKPFAQMMSALSPRRTALLVTSGTQREVLLSARNIPRVSVRSAEDLNVLDVLNAQCVVLVRDAVPCLEQRLARNNG